MTAASHCFTVTLVPFIVMISQVCFQQYSSDELCCQLKAQSCVQRPMFIKVIPVIHAMTQIEVSIQASGFTASVHSKTIYNEIGVLACSAKYFRYAIHANGIHRALTEKCKQLYLLLVAMVNCQMVGSGSRFANLKNLKQQIIKCKRMSYKL